MAHGLNSGRGPWQWDGIDGRIWIVDADGAEMCSVTLPEHEVQDALAAAAAEEEQMRIARSITHSVNSYDDLYDALRLALPAIDMHTTLGARDWPSDTPKDYAGDVDLFAIAQRIRTVLAKAEG